MFNKIILYDRRDTEKLRKQLDNMKKRMEEIQEENKTLWRKLEIIKSKVDVSVLSALKKKDSSAQTPRNPVKRNKKDEKKEERKERSLKNIKRNSQPVITLLERKGKNLRIRRELSFPPDNRESRNMEEETVVTAGNLDRRAEETNNKKRNDRINTLEKSSTKKRRECREEEKHYQSVVENSGKKSKKAEYRR